MVGGGPSIEDTLNERRGGVIFVGDGSAHYFGGGFHTRENITMNAKRYACRLFENKHLTNMVEVSRGRHVILVGKEDTADQFAALQTGVETLKWDMRYEKKAELLSVAPACNVAIYESLWRGFKKYHA